MPKTQAKETKTAKSTKTEKKSEKKVVEVEKKVETTQPKASKKTTQKGGDKVPKEKKSKRSFKAIYVNPAGEVVMEGRYCGAKPKQAGCKALTGIYKLFAKAKKQIKGEIFFGVRETTRGSRNKTYYYSGERVVLDEPIELQIGGGSGGEAKTITYKYNSNVKKASEDDCEHLSNPREVAEEEPKEPVAKKATKKTEAKVEVKVVEAKTESKSEKKADTKKKAKK